MGWWLGCCSCVCRLFFVLFLFSCIDCGTIFFDRNFTTTIKFYSEAVLFFKCYKISDIWGKHVLSSNNYGSAF